MTDSVADYPYETRLNILYPPLEVIDEKALADACEFKWFNQTLCKVNESVVRVGIIEGEYHWHKHDEDDEFFYVVEGKLLIDLEDRIVELNPRQGFVVPKGIVHRTRAPQRTVILMVENAGIIPTGS
ncbi:MAG TPA: cupin domain-containing protein [Terracidiphilus sp.]|jgi:mannose-6-phosphate isomerase-like protein (cupin superfamily)